MDGTPRKRELSQGSEGGEGLTERDEAAEGREKSRGRLIGRGIRGVRGRRSGRGGVEVLRRSGVVRDSVDRGGRRTSRFLSAITGRRWSSWSLQETIEPIQVLAGGVVDSVPCQSELMETRSRVIELERENSIQKDENESLVNTLNEYKIANKNLEKKLEEEKLSGTVVLQEYRRVESELSAQTLEKKMLRDAVEEMIAKAVRDKRMHSKTSDKIFGSVEPQLAGVAMKVSRSIPTWCGKEVSELRHFASGSAREWRERSEVSNEMCLFSIDRGGVPLSPFIVAKSGKHFSPPTDSEEEALYLVIEKKLEMDRWHRMFTESTEKEDVIKRLARNGGIWHRLKQTLSDVCSAKKRAARDCLFESLGYGSLLSRSFASTAEHFGGKRHEVLVARRILLRKVHGGEEIETGCWRMCRDLDKLRIEDESDNVCDEGDEAMTEITSLSEHAIVYELGNKILGLLMNDILRQVLKQFIEFDASRDGTSDGSVMDDSIMWLALLDARIATVTDFLTKRESRGGHLQKLYSDKYGKYLVTLFEQLIENIRVYVEYWAGEQFCASLNEEIMKVFVTPTTKERYSNVNEDWFTKYVSTKLERVVRCTVARVEKSGVVEMLGKPTVGIDVLQKESGELL